MEIEYLKSLSNAKLNGYVVRGSGKNRFSNHELIENQKSDFEKLEKINF